MYQLTNKIKDEETTPNKKNIEVVITKEEEKEEKRRKKENIRREYSHIYPFLALIIINMGIIIIAVLPTFTGFLGFEKEPAIIEINKTLMPGSSIKLEEYDITNTTSLKISGTQEVDDEVLIILVSKEKRFIIYNSERFHNDKITGFSIINLTKINETNNIFSNETNITSTRTTINCTNNNTAKKKILEEITFKKVCVETCSLNEIINQGEIVIKSKKPVKINQIIYEKNKQIPLKKEE